MTPSAQESPVRVIHTNLPALPEAVQKVLLESKRDANVTPHAISLGSPGRPGLTMLAGLALAGATFVAYMVEGEELLTPDGVYLVIALAMLAPFAFTYGLVTAFRTMALRLQKQAILYPPGWLTCTTGIGSNLELIPLASVAEIVPGSATLDVKLRDGSVRQYPMKFAIPMKSFFEVARAAITNATPPNLADPGLPKETPRPGTAMPLVVATVAGVVLGIPVAGFAIHKNATDEYETLEFVGRMGLAEAEESEGQARIDAQARTLEFVFARLSRDRTQSPISVMALERFTPILALEARCRTILDSAHGVQRETSEVNDRAIATSGTDIGPLRRVVTAHPNDEIGTLARERVEILLTQTRAREATSGATPDMLAFCDRMRSDAATSGRAPIALRVVRDANEALGAFDVEGWSAGGAELAAAHHAIATEASEQLRRSLETGLGVPPSGEGVIATLTVALRPSGEVMQYTSRRASTRELVSTYSVPVLTVDVRATLRFGEESAEYSSSHTAIAQTMSEENMASAYPSPELLYAAEGRELGTWIGSELARKLCMP